MNFFKDFAEMWNYCTWRGKLGIVLVMVAILLPIAGIVHVLFFS